MPPPRLRRDRHPNETVRDRLVTFACAASIALGLSGCGLAVVVPLECENEAPTIDSRDFFAVSTQAKKPPWPPKSAFLDAWGKPDAIEPRSPDHETWLYEKRLWCGPIPWLILPVPLLLPVCDGFDRIDFRDDRARILHTRRSVTMGILFPFVAGSDPRCRNPIPLPLKKRIQPDRSVFLSVGVGPGERDGKGHDRVVADLVRDDLTAELADSGIFRGILSEPDSADYLLDVEVTSAQIRTGAWSTDRFNAATVEVRLIRRGTGESIGDFQVEESSPLVTTGIDQVVRSCVEKIILVLRDE